MTTQIGAILSDPYVTPDTAPPAPVMGVLETTITASLETIVSGATTVKAETYNGAIPGPTLRLNVGDTAIVRLINELPYPTGIHWHGIELANSADGTEVTQNGVVPAFASIPPAPPGGTYLYKFTVTRPGIFWYHPHHHHSPNRVFRGLYGMIVVTDPNETTLANGVLPNGFVLPGAADTRQIVLSDITVCKMVGSNTSYDLTLPWVGPGGVLPVQPGITPAQLCEFPTATADNGDPAPASYGAGDVPSIMAMSGRINEGQIVLTNGVNVGGRAGTPAAPGALAAGAYTLPVLSGQGLRLQIVNCATTRYFRLLLTAPGIPPVQLVRVGGEGGLLNNAIVEGANPPVPPGTFDPKYTSGEILLPPSVRADIVAAIPAGLAAGTVLTLWTQDFQRLSGFANLPTVPVMHLEVTGPVAGAPYTIGPGTPLRAAAGFPGPALTAVGGPITPLLTPAGGFVAPKFGMSNQDITLTSGTPGINAVVGSFEGPAITTYTGAPHIDSTRYAEAGRTLQLTVTNQTSAHHPFHLHGFSFQPISLTQAGLPSFTFPIEFRDSIDVPANYTLTFMVRLEDRPLLDGTTLGGWLGRWLFHCHIFFHHHRGMISELVVTDGSGREKPNVDVGGSWAYTPAPGMATRKGTFFSLDSTVVSLTATDAAGTPVGTITSFVPGASGEWEWEYVSPGGDEGVRYVYITGTDALGMKDQAVFRLKIGEPDDGADNGDPHIRTVDGKYYDFQAVGEFTLLRDPAGMEIQVRQTPVPTATPITDSYSGLTVCVSINTAVAARIGKHRLAYQPSDQGRGEMQLLLDGKPARLTERGLDLEGGRLSAYTVGGTTGFRVDYDNYTVLTVTPHFWNSYNVWYLNVSVSHTDADQGLMGRIPPQTWLPLLRNGASVGPRPAALHDRYVALYKTFADSWRVTDQTSLFVYAPGTSTKTFTDRDWPSDNPPPCKPLPEFEIPGANPPLVNIRVDTAKRICRPVTVDDLNAGCVFDVATTGDKSLVDSYLIAQEIRLNGTAVQLVADKARTRPGEAVRFTATVSALTSKRPIPTGSVAFLIDDVQAGPPIELDKQGRATLKTASLATGVRRVRAVFAAKGEQTAFHNSSSPTLRHPVARRAPADRGKAPYRLIGSFYEACDCFTICPCWLGNEPDEGACTGVFAWDIEKGTIDGVDVSGLRAVSVSHHSGLREEARQRVVILVDDRASRQQMDAIAAAFSGRLGGPLQELADILGDLLAVERAPIVLRREGRLTTLTVDRRIRIEGSATEGPSGRATALKDGRLSAVLGSPAEVGASGRFRIGLPAHGMDIDVRGRSTMSGRFSYVHVPASDSRVPRGHG